jgi:anti-sigma regulatory factor (Ser/Thr protein kinase)
MLTWMRNRDRKIRAEAMAAATADRLVLVERGALDAEWPGVGEGQPLRREGLGVLRAEVRGAAALAGIGGTDGERVEAFVLAAAEAATNALVHAGGAWYQVRHRPGRLRVRVWDCGKGIGEPDLLRATLCPGWSSRESLGLGWITIVAGCDCVRLATDRTGTTVLLELRACPSAPLVGAAAELFSRWLIAADG